MKLIFNDDDVAPYHEMKMYVEKIKAMLYEG
jgi:hypothetical protein